MKNLFKTIVIASALPLAGYPWLLSACPAYDPYKTLVALYPVYVVLSSALEWLCWPARKTVAWILIALLWLSHAAIYALIFLV